MIFEALKHWWSRHPFFILLMLATFYIDKETRNKSISVFNIAMLIFCVNFLLVRYGFMTKDQPACYLLFRTTSPAVGLVMWSVFWLYCPFTLRNIKFIRHILPKYFLLSMNIAVRTSPFDLIAALIPSWRKKRLTLLAIPLVLIRWSIVIAVVYFVFAVNTSRTAQLSMLVVIAAGLIIWNWRKGIFITVIIVTCILVLAMSNEYFVKKWYRTYDSVQDVISKDADSFNENSKNKDRHWILMKLIPEIKKRPIVGYGLDINFRIVGEIIPKRYIHTHCEFTQIAIQFGLVGMGLFILLLVTTFMYATGTPPPINRFVIAVLLVILIDISFNGSLYTDRQIYVILFSFAVAIAEIAYNLQQKIHHPKKIATIQPRDSIV
jgi:hypothetical protein